MGGQTALNLAIECDKAGIWEKHKVRMIGVNVDAINTTEDRELFRLKMKELDVNVCKGEIAKSFLRGKEIAQEIGFPLVIRPSFTLGGSGGGIVDEEKDPWQKLCNFSEKNSFTYKTPCRSIHLWMEISRSSHIFCANSDAPH